MTFCHMSAMNTMRARANVDMLVLEKCSVCQIVLVHMPGDLFAHSRYSKVVT